MKNFFFFSTLSFLSIYSIHFLHGDDFPVTRAADDSNPGSLRRAIIDLNTKAAPENTITIKIPSATTIQLSSDLPVIQKNVAISAPDAMQTIDGQGSFRLITGKGNISVDNCTLTGGLAKGGKGGTGTPFSGSGGGGLGAGGAIYVNPGQIATLQNVTLSRNKAEGGMGGTSMTGTDTAPTGGGGGAASCSVTDNRDGATPNGAGDVPGIGRVGGASDPVGGSVGYGGGKGGASSFFVQAGMPASGGNGPGSPASTTGKGGYCGGCGGCGNTYGANGGNGGGDGTASSIGGGGGGVASGGAGGISVVIAGTMECFGGGGGGFGGGGGGGAGTDTSKGNAGGGGGGFGAGGGGGAYGASDKTAGLGGIGGRFGGKGAPAATGDKVCGGGGGGAGLGGGIFVGNAASLYIGNRVVISDNLVVGGIGGGTGLAAGVVGDGYAPDVFLFREATLIFNGNADQVIAFAIQSDQTAPTTAPGHLDKGVQQAGTGMITLSSINNNYRGGTRITKGTLKVSSDANLGNAAGGILLKDLSILQVTDSFSSSRPISLDVGGKFIVDLSKNLTLTGVISGAGALSMEGPGTLILQKVNTYTGTTTINNGVLQLGITNALPVATILTIANLDTAIFDLNNNDQTIGNLAGGGKITLGSGTLTVGDATTSSTYSGVISGSGKLNKMGTGTLILAGPSIYTGATTVNQGILQLGVTNALPIATSLTLVDQPGVAFNLNGYDQTVTSLAGGGKITLGSGMLTVGDATASTTYSGVISGSGKLNKVGTGTLVLAGLNTYTGTTTINDGILQINMTNGLPVTTALTLANLDTAIFDLNNNDQTITSLAGRGKITLGSGTLTVGDATASTTYSGAISGSGKLNKVGTGTLVLAGLNTYTGTTTISDGILQINVTNGLPVTTTLTLANVDTATFDLNSKDQTIVSIKGGGKVALGSGTLTVGDATPSLTYSGVISGLGGGLTKTGSGTLVLTGLNTYTGATRVNDGILQVGAENVLSPTTMISLADVPGVRLDLNNYNQTIGNLAGGGSVILGTATLTLGDVTSQVFTGTVNGTGDLIKQGTGTWTLEGTNNFSSITIKDGEVVVSSSNNFGDAEVIINGGKLHIAGMVTISQIGLAGSLPSLNVDTGKTLTFSQGLEITNPGMTIFKGGAGSLDIQGAIQSPSDFSGGLVIGDGTVFLTNDASLTKYSKILLPQQTSTFDISRASGDRDIASVDGLGTVNTGANHLTVFNEDDCGFDGEITGTGGMTKYGAGTLKMTGHSLAFSGDSHAREGLLQIEGTLPNSMIVYEGASLGGNGSLGPVTNYGYVTPGASIGTMTVASFTQGPTGTLEVEVNDLGQSDLLIVTGTATLNGLVEIVPEPGVYLSGTTYTFLQFGSRSGSFSNLTVRSSDDFLFDVTYLSNSAILQLFSGSNNNGGPIFPVSLLHGNAKKVGVFLEQCANPGTDLTKVLQNFQLLSLSELETVLNGLTPAQFGAFDVMNYNNSRSIMDLFSNQLTQLYGCKIGDPIVSAWVQPLGSYVDQKMAEGNFGFHAWSLGAAFGTTSLYNNCIIGWGIGVLHTELGWEKGMGHGRQQNYYGGIYGGYHQDRWYVSGSLLGAGNDYETHRGIHFANIDRTASSNHMGGEVSGRLQGGMNFNLKHALRVQPYLVVDSYNSFEGGYGENGADSLNLTVKSHYSGMVRVNPAVEIVREISSKLGCVTPSIYLGYAFEAPMANGVLQSNFAGCCCDILEGQTFYKNRNQICGGASIQGTLKNGPALSVHYEFNAGSRYFSNNADISIQWSF